MSRNIGVFISYAREDEKPRKNLEKHLKSLQHEGIISVWYDRNISAGTEWKYQIDMHLDAAQLILLLISPDFLASDYCYSKEMVRAIERHDNGKARVIPIILRRINWQSTPFGQLKALPIDGRPVTGSTWRNQDEALFNVTESIIEVIANTNIIHSSHIKKNGIATKKFSDSKNTLPHILSIDDRFANELIEFVLKKEGFNVSTVENAHDAIEFIAEKKPDLLLLDIGLPDINGFKLAEKLQKEGHEIPIIFSTAADTIEAKIQGFELGAEDYICKPFNHQELVHRVRVVMRHCLYKK